MQGRRHAPPPPRPDGTVASVPPSTLRLPRRRESWAGPVIAVVIGVALVVGVFGVGIGLLVLQSAGPPTIAGLGDAPSPPADAAPRSPQSSPPVAVEPREDDGFRLEPPWSEMGLPVSSSATGYQDDHVLALQQPGATAVIAPFFHAALIADGWERSEVLGEGGAHIGKYTAGNRTLELVVADTPEGRVAVALTLKDVAGPTPPPAPMAVAYGTEGDNALKEPWSQFLPDEPRHVIAQVASAITMDIPGSPPEVGARYERALLDRGWTPVAALAMMGESGGGVYDKGGVTLSVGVSRSFLGGEGTSISLARND